MGSWHATCNISQLPITPGTPVRVLFLGRCPYSTDDSTEGRNGREGVYSTDFWYPRTIPLKAVYDDYGRVDKIDETGLAYSLFWEQLKSDLYPVEEGENPYHDPSTSLDMDWDQMWWAASEGRLLVKRESYFVKEGRKPALPICAVMIREDVYQAMLNLQCVHRSYDRIDGKEYSPDQDFSDKNYKCYNVDYFKDKFAKVIEVGKDLRDNPPDETTSYRDVKYVLYNMLDRYSPPGMQGISFYVEKIASLIATKEMEPNDPKIERLINDISEIEYIMLLFSYLRKTWHPGTGCGSQGNDLDQAFLYYRAMSEVALTVHKEEAKESRRWDRNYKDPLGKYRLKKNEKR
jgi:hypothetical protein